MAHSQTSMANTWLAELGSERNEKNFPETLS